MKAGDIGWTVSWETKNQEDDSLDSHSVTFKDEAAAFAFAETKTALCAFGAVAVDRFVLVEENPGEFPILLGRHYADKTHWVERGE